MSLNRIKELELDWLLSDLFFDFKEDKGMETRVSFELPASAEDLPQFLRDDTAKGQAYKNGFKVIIENLAWWAKDNNIDNSACDRFLAIYLGNSGADSDMNTRNFHIYHDGISALASIVTLVNNDKIQLDSRRDGIINLFKGLLKCGPGTFTNIMNCNLSLHALAEASIFWMMLRRGIAEQVVVEHLRTEQLPKEIFHDAWEIHYVNAVLNRFSDALGIQMIEDYYVNKCDIPTVDFLIDKFKSVIGKIITLDKVIDVGFESISFDELARDIKTPKYADAIKKLEFSLASFGEEAPDKLFYAENRVIKLYGDFSDQTCFSWCAKDIILSSLYSRLIQKGYIELFGKELMHPLNETTEVRYLPDNSLQLSYVCQPQNSAIVCQPFIGFCVESLATNSEKDSEALLKFICSSRLTEQHRTEIRTGIFRYWSSVEFKEKEKEEQDLISIRLTAIIFQLTLISKMSATAFLKFIESVPEDRRMVLLKAVNTKMLVGFVHDGEILGKYFSLLPVADWKSFFNLLEKERIKTIIRSSEAALEFLSSLNRSKHQFIMDSFGKDIFSGINGMSTRHFRATFFALSEDARIKLIGLFDEDQLKSLFKDTFLVKDMFLKLPEREWGAFLEFLEKIGLFEHSFVELVASYLVLDEANNEKGLRFLKTIGYVRLAEAFYYANGFVSLRRMVPKGEDGNQLLAAVFGQIKENVCKKIDQEIIQLNVPNSLFSRSPEMKIQALKELKVNFLSSQYKNEDELSSMITEWYQKNANIINANSQILPFFNSPSKISEFINELIYLWGDHRLYQSITKTPGKD